MSIMSQLQSTIVGVPSVDPNDWRRLSHHGSSSSENDMSARVGLHNVRDAAHSCYFRPVFELLLHVARIEWSEVATILERATITPLLSTLSECFLCVPRGSDLSDPFLHLCVRLLHGNALRGLVGTARDGVARFLMLDQQ